MGLRKQVLGRRRTDLTASTRPQSGLDHRRKRFDLSPIVRFLEINESAIYFYLLFSPGSTLVRSSYLGAARLYSFSDYKEYAEGISARPLKTEMHGKNCLQAKFAQLKSS